MILFVLQIHRYKVLGSRICVLYVLFCLRSFKGGHIYWILDLGDEMHSIWNFFGEVAFKNARAKVLFGSRAGSENPGFFVGQWLLTENFSPERQVGCRISSSVITTLLS